MLESQLAVAVFSLQKFILWKHEASSKNNALNYRVRFGSSACKCIIFYLLIGMFWLVLWWIDAWYIFKNNIVQLLRSLIVMLRH